MAWEPDFSETNDEDADSVVPLRPVSAAPELVEVKTSDAPVAQEADESSDGDDKPPTPPAGGRSHLRVVK